MTTTNLDLGKWSTISAVLFLLASPLLAAPASADKTDRAFLAALQQHGIAFTDDDAAIATAHSVCDGLDQGQTRSSLALSLVKNTSLSAHEAGYFLGVSVASYCPQHNGGA
ncbi:DUF732 domain-containing protein [Mycobacterium intracellulare]|uniref:DUF732 domain-containing protein n=1 Tax=Mycobacterium intracellulare TaxID=1767 RepID=UPI001F60F8FA|nr:DUF732 domain-containing protein [Mycobacterium intracellulare]